MRATASPAELSRSNARKLTTEVLQSKSAIPDSLQLHGLIRFPGWSGSLQSSASQRVELDHSADGDPFPCWRCRCAVYVQLAGVPDRTLPLLDGDGAGDQYGLSP